ncbi:unnamed protein product [Prorocentrum cordatum]|uniref:Uncharacterized protein n=1 Tax=Prorocentrum cordatum TaxID=2364126 RepID=A0ABN9Y1V4_9DINO|nr:unnamed protein product [Polarella glacialis]
MPPLRGAAFLLGCLLAESEACSLHLAKKCRGYECEDPVFPVLDYDTKKHKCVCIPHPCWNVRRCPADKPYPIFNFDADSKINCTCSTKAICNSKYVASVKCPGHMCADDSQHPILDFDDKEKSCICRAHPCWDDDGQRHDCDSETHPLLRYREELSRSGAVKSKCECSTILPIPGKGGAGSKEAVRKYRDEEL